MDTPDYQWGIALDTTKEKAMELLKQRFAKGWPIGKEEARQALEAAKTVEEHTLDFNLKGSN